MRELFIILFILQSANASTIGQFFSSSSTVSSGRAVFERDGTWVVPTGVTKISVQVIGAGGGASGSGGGGGGGGGSCIKDGATVLSSANGGKGASNTDILGLPGDVTNTTITVTPGATLSIYVGGGGGGGVAVHTSLYSGGGGGYGACGTGGAGGSYPSYIGGTSGANLGGGGGGGTSYAGVNATTSTGGNAGHPTYGGRGGSATVGGSVGGGAGGGGGGASGGMGGYGGLQYTTTPAVYIIGSIGMYSKNTIGINGYTGGDGVACNQFMTLLPGNGGIEGYCMLGLRFATGGAGGSVTISW